MGLFFLGVLAAGILGAIIYVFLSKKSSKPLKLAALGALILSGLALGVCAFFLFTGPRVVDEGPYALPPLVQAAAPAAKTNAAPMLIFFVILLVFFGFIFFLGFKDRKKKAMDEAIANTKDSDLEDSF
jgi:uncharacterized RDD family membrane protein YckC